jgi:hypothetical protein
MCYTSELLANASSAEQKVLVSNQESLGQAWRAVGYTAQEGKGTVHPDISICGTVHNGANDGYTNAFLF